MCVSSGQLKKVNEIDLLSERPVRLGQGEEVTYETATIAVRKALQLNRAIQASDAHWPAENAGPMFFTPPLVMMFFFFLPNLLQKVLYEINY